MKFKDKIKAKEYRQAKEAVKECLKRDWKRSEGEGWITERTYRVRRNKSEKLLPSFAFLTPYPTLLNPQPFIPAPTLPHSIQFTLHHKDPTSTSSSSPFTFHQPQTAFTHPPPPPSPSPSSPSSSQSSQSAEIKAEGGKEGGEMKVKADLSHAISSDTSSHSLHLSSEISSPEGHQFTQEVRLTSEISPSDLDLPKPDMDPNIIDHSKHIIDHDHDEELTWDAVRILVEADGTSFYGLGEIAGSLSLNDLCELSIDDLDLDNEDDLAKNPGESDDPYYHPPQSEHENPSPYKQRRSRRNKKGITICWNTDVGLYSHLNPSLYQSHPFLISLLRDGTSNAYYLDSTFLSIVHLSKIRLSDSIDINNLNDNIQHHPKDKEGGKEYYQIMFISRSSNSPPLYIMQAKSPQEIAQEITRLFGSISLPPKWAIGYQQCRYSYYPDSRVVSIAESFRRYHIPCDVIWMDIHYMNEYRCFQFSSKHFPDPPALSNKLHTLGFHGVWMIDPGIKVDDQYEVFKSGLRGDHFILKHSAKEALSLEISDEEMLDKQHLDEPPSLEEYPEIKEAENIIDITDEPGFNRRPDLDDQDFDYYPPPSPSLSPAPSPSPKSRHMLKGRSPRSSRSPSRSPRVRRPDPALPSHPLSRNPLSSYGDYISPAITSGEGEAGVGRGESILVEPLIEGYDDTDLYDDDDDEYWEEEYEEKVVIRPKRMRKVEELEIRKVWPGDCVFPDFTRRETRKWWGALYSSFLVKNGIDGIWNDMNEVAAFGEGGTINRKCWHRADRELGGGDDHSRYHNVYGFLMTLATKQGMKHARKDRREFVLTRANFMGGHRHAATWTGDNTSNWDHLGWTIPMILNLSLSGQLFCGVDIGGFFGDATPELFARWMGFGTLLPFARAHSCVRTRNHEPWSFGAEVKRVCKKAIERRYRLLGYYYTLFYEGSQVTSLPILQPLFYQNPADQRLRDVDSIFTIGSSLLVVTDLNPPSPHPPPSHHHHQPTTPSSDQSTSSSDQAMTDEERFVRRLAQERRKEEDRRREEKRMEMITNANPMTDDEDMVVEDEHLEEETQEEEDERKRYLKGRKENDRFPSDILPRSDWIRFHVLDDFSDQFETELPEMYIKRGSIIPLISLSQHVLPAPQYFLLPLSLSFSFPPPHLSTTSPLLIAEGNLYEDEGDSFDYQTLQSYSYVKFRIERSPSSFSHPPSDLRHSRSEMEEINVTTTHLHLDDKEDTKEEKVEEDEEKIVVYLIHLSNSNAFYPDRDIYVTEITSENAHHPTPLFHFHQHQFQESFHPAYANHKVYSYVHHLKKPSRGHII